LLGCSQYGSTRDGHHLAPYHERSADFILAWLGQIRAQYQHRVVYCADRHALKLTPYRWWTRRYVAHSLTSRVREQVLGCIEAARKSSKYRRTLAADISNREELRLG
jgi:hypothetical protein